MQALTSFRSLVESFSVSSLLQQGEKKNEESSQVPIPKTGVTAIREIVGSFLGGINYQSPEGDDGQKVFLAETLRSDFSAHRQNDQWFETACRLGATMAEMAYQSHPPEVKLLIARFTFLVLYIDDFGHKFQPSLERFQQTILSPNATSDEPILQAFRAHLCDIYTCWEPIASSCIVTSAIDFVNGCILESDRAVQDMEISKDAKSWPDYLRQKTGLASAYAFMIFPLSQDYNVADFVQTIGDIMIFINLTNDILSFYKEEMANETGTYVHNRARVNGKTAIDTVQEISEEAVAAYSRVSSVLKSQRPAVFDLWMTFVSGYTACHITESRYRMRELGF